MDCFNDYIGLQGCSTTTPDSGLYVNELSGIQLRQIDEIANENQQNYVGVWADVQKRALAMFDKDLRKAMREKYKLTGVTQSVNIGKVIDTATTRTGSAEYRGTTIELNQSGDVTVYSNFQVIFIQTIKIYVPSAETFNVKIYDLDTEAELYTSSQTTTSAGWLDVNINDYFLGSRRIFVAYDCTSINSVKLDIDPHNLNCFEKCESRVRGGYATTGDPYTVTSDPYNTHGMSLIFSIQCKNDVVACNNKHLFANALQYLLGSELLFEVINSSRVNQWTMLDNKQAKYLRGYYKAMYKGGMFDEEEFEGELSDAVALLPLDQYDCCVNCSGALQFHDSYI